MIANVLPVSMRWQAVALQEIRKKPVLIMAMELAKKQYADAVLDKIQSAAKGVKVMTNSEAIEQLKFLKKADFHIDTKEACDIAINKIIENDELKDLKDAIIHVISEVEKENTKLKAEAGYTKEQFELLRIKHALCSALAEKSMSDYSKICEENEQLKAEIGQLKSESKERGKQ